MKASHFEMNAAQEESKSDKLGETATASLTEQSIAQMKDLHLNSGNLKPLRCKRVKQISAHVREYRWQQPWRYGW